jgi:hypothetical protein
MRQKGQSEPIPKNPLAQFAATSTTTTKAIVNNHSDNHNNSSKENMLPQKSRMERNSSLSKSRNAPKEKGQPSALSKLFAGPTAMMSMFDDDDEDENVTPLPRSGQTTALTVHATAHGSGSIFQNSNLAGLIDMFDDDDDEI